MRQGDFRGCASPARSAKRGRRPAWPFANNRILASRLDPVALALLKQMPLPNLPGIAQNLLATASPASSFPISTARASGLSVFRQRTPRISDFHYLMRAKLTRLDQTYCRRVYCWLPAETQDTRLDGAANWTRRVSPLCCSMRRASDFSRLQEDKPAPTQATLSRRRTGCWV